MDQRPISQAQIRKLWAGARELGLDSDELRALLSELTGRASIRALTVAEAIRVIDELVTRGASSGRRRRLPGDVPRLITPWQCDEIRRLATELGWQNARALVEGVVMRAIGRVNPRTSAEGSKVIEAFKAILRRRNGDPAPREGQGV